MNASQNASDRSWKLIEDAFAQVVPETSGYTLCYGYWIKTGIFSKKIFNYAIGFRTDTKEIVVVPIDSDGNRVDEAIRLQKSDITRVKKTLQGVWEISSSLTDKPLSLTVPYFLPDAVEDTYQLPINQHEQGERFWTMMKNY